MVQQKKFKCFATTIMVTKFNNVTPKIQATKNIVLFLIAPSLKNVVTSS
jgi:hypothetical protein